MLSYCYQSLFGLQGEYKLAFLWNMKKAGVVETQLAWKERDEVGEADSVWVI